MELTCRFSCATLLTSNVRRAGSTLQWVEGGILVEPDTSRNIVTTAAKVVLQIHNLTLTDYGRYQCRCVNMYGYVQYRACGHSSDLGLPSHCAASTELDLLPPGMYVCIYSAQTPKHFSFSSNILCSLNNGMPLRYTTSKLTPAV